MRKWLQEFILDYSCEGHLVGIEILDASKLIAEIVQQAMKAFSKR